LKITKKIKNHNFKRGLVIGPSGIGRVHLRQFYKNKIKYIGVLGKSFKKKRLLQLNTSGFKNLEIENLKSFNDIKKFKPNVISICSPTEKHLEHILKCNNYGNYIIVEKPFIYPKKNKKITNTYKIASNILASLRKKIVINLPMVSLGNQLIKKKETSNKIKNLKFMYYTKGKQTYDNIAIDLLPHAIVFLLTINKSLLKSYEIKSVTKNKSDWSCKMKINNTICHFLFKQSAARKESNLFFKINKNYYERKQKLLNGEYVTTLIKNKKKIINVKNPMTEYLNLLLKNFKNPKAIGRNHRLTLDITRLTDKLLNWSINFNN